MELQYLKALYLSNRAIKLTGKRNGIDLTFKMLITAQCIIILNGEDVSISAKRIQNRIRQDKTISIDHDTMQRHITCLVNAKFLNSVYVEKPFNSYYIYTPTPKLFTMLKAFNSTLKRMKIN